MNENPYKPNTVQESRSGGQNHLFGRFAQAAASLVLYVVTASLGATAALSLARPSNSFAQQLDLLYKHFFTNSFEKLVLAVISLVTAILVHGLARIALPGLLLRALTFGFVGGFLVMLLPAAESMIGDDSPLRLLRWFARKSFWLYVAVVTFIQLLFELSIFWIDRFSRNAGVGLDAKSGAHIE